MNFNATRAFVWIVVAANVGSTVNAADADHGELVAKRWCAACHIVAADQKRGADNVPSFASVAKRSDFSAANLAFFLLDPHPKMPNMALTRREAEDIAAYVARLRD
jgi:mono/diheme cytochrome c family protein